MIFLGTPEFAVEPLVRLVGLHEVVACVTQPDRVRGRGRGVVKSPVKIAAERLGIPVLQFERIRDGGAEILSAYNSDIMVTAAYGQILTADILHVAKHGVVNAHASLLPKYRGPSPIQHMLLNGETEAGVTIMQTELGVDTGPVILSKRCGIDGADNFETLTHKLSGLAADALADALALIESGKAVRTPQDDAAATRCGMIKKPDYFTDFCEPAQTIVNKCRAFYPDFYAVIGGKRLRLLQMANDQSQMTKAGKDSNESNLSSVICHLSSEPGTVLVSKGRFIARAADGAVEICRVLPQDSKPMDAAAYLAGHRHVVGEKFEIGPAV
ncbi:MAG: hypothetical protein FWE62_00485 [Firmicutes bacterium]|nr:hypothetical protein [Bacillota bacterium]